MKISVLTLFPSYFDAFLSTSIIKRAYDKGLFSFETIDFRTFTHEKHGHVDDTPYGGGAGMVLMCQPILDALASIRTPESTVILLSPQGKTFNQSMAIDLSKKSHLIFICGHYEGFDERIKTICDMFISVGDFILTGGEIPSMLITDSIVRLLDGVIDKESLESESFNSKLLDYPTYTKPRDFEGMLVPDVLLSGDHKKIAEYRKNEQIKKTKELRPDLLEEK